MQGHLDAALTSAESVPLRLRQIDAASAKAWADLLTSLVERVGQRGDGVQRLDEVEAVRELIGRLSALVGDGQPGVAELHARLEALLQRLRQRRRTRIIIGAAAAFVAIVLVGVLIWRHGEAKRREQADRRARVAAMEAKWVTVRAGTFEMGSPETEPGRQDDEVEHSVTLTRDFVISPTEVTQAQFLEWMRYNPSSRSGCDSCPVETVSWHEAAAYCNALSAAAGLATCYSCSGTGTSVSCELSSSYSTPYACPGYRLPTEAEWEYAARAGTTTATNLGNLDAGHLGCQQPNAALDSIAWYCGNSGGATHAVGGKEANAWGLYDMLGNVWEWCGDWHGDYPAGSATDPWGPSGGSDRVDRGGSWYVGARFARAACRDRGGPGGRGGGLGLRPVRSSR
jgi:formylglycine-generating enzyme required for sulfatase activity